jgi:predicted transcriptional regulator of viral defense system
MELKKIAKGFGDAPFSRHLMLEILKDYKRPNDKISELIKRGELLSIRRGLYIPGPETDLPVPDLLLIANHLRGPSYVSLEAALSYWGLIPERVYEITSITIQTAKKYNTPIGRFTYQYLPSPYYSFGIEIIQLTSKQSALIASREKAVCDKIILTSGVTLRSMRQTKDFLLEDLRMDVHILRKLDTSVIHSWLTHAPKKNSLEMLIKTLKEL